MLQKKNFFIFTVSLILILNSLLCACVKNNFSFPITNGEFSVHFINVGQGDGTLICFDDGKTMLIDCGADNDQNAKLIVSTIENYSNGVLDYFVLTHPDIDHIGNAYRIAESLSVAKAYIPNIKNKGLFLSFERAVNVFNTKQTKTDVSDMFDYVQGKNYFLAFLYPGLTTDDNVYDTINSIENPTDEQVNALCPIIYLRYKDVKFLFTGDADFFAEQTVKDYYDIGFYDCVYPENIELDDMDFLKVAHHGSESSSSLEFLKLLKPKNAIISVGGANVYGHPSTLTLKRLVGVNEDINILRTDVCGTISVKINSSGTSKIVTEAD